MILIFLVIGIILTVTGIVVAVKNNEWDNGAVIASLTSGIPTVLFSLIAFFVCLTPITSQKAINEKIEFYEEENQRIENSITIVVEKYLQHEEIVYDNLSVDEVNAYLVVYPELRSNEIISKQIDVLASNSDKLKELKSEKADISTYKWWVYFG